MPKEMLIITHKNPDFDAIASASILEKELKKEGFDVDIEFISSYEDIDVTECIMSYAVDITPKFKVTVFVFWRKVKVIP